LFDKYVPIKKLIFESLVTHKSARAECGHYNVREAPQPRADSEYFIQGGLSKGTQRSVLLYFICLLCSFPELIRFLSLEREDLASVQNTRVISHSYNRFSVWSSNILLLAALLLLGESTSCTQATPLALHGLGTIVRAVLHAL
jgi:hypothetical protein